MPRLKPLAALGLLALFGYQYSFAEDRQLSSELGPLNVHTVAEGLANPWAVAFLPDGRVIWSASGQVAKLHLI